MAKPNLSKVIVFHFLIDLIFLNFISATIKYSEECGVVEAAQTYIVGGEEAAPGSFPWIVSIKYKGGHTCGGVIVNKYWTLTAAHCFFNKEDSTLEKEENYKIDITRDGSIKNVTQTLLIASLKIHPNYNVPKDRNDIALIKHKVPISVKHMPACFPEPKEDHYGEALVAGWGVTSSGSGKIATRLRVAKVPLLFNSECRKWLKDKKISIYSTQICAGYAKGGHDSCQGDSGGPLMKMGRNAKFVAIGITSFGLGCARARSPGVYTKISEYISWIDNIVNVN